MKVGADPVLIASELRGASSSCFQLLWVQSVVKDPLSAKIAELRDEFGLDREHREGSSSCLFLHGATTRHPGVTPHSSRRLSTTLGLRRAFRQAREGHHSRRRARRSSHGPHEQCGFGSASRRPFARKDAATNRSLKTAEDRPRRYRTRFQETLHEMQPARKDSEDAERARWIAVIDGLHVNTVLKETPKDAEALGGGRRASTVRTRGRRSKKILFLLQLKYDLNYPDSRAQCVEFLRVRVSEPCNRGSINPHWFSLLGRDGGLQRCRQMHQPRYLPSNAQGAACNGTARATHAHLDAGRIGTARHRQHKASIF